MGGVFAPVGGVLLALASVPAHAVIPGVAWTATPDQVGANLGASVASAGDVDGDGFADVVVGIPNLITPISPRGAAWVHQGSAAGLGAAPSWRYQPTGAWVQLQDLGASVASAGDVNGDGFDDVLVATPSYTDGPTLGRVLVFDGSPAGLQPTPSVELPLPGGPWPVLFVGGAVGAGDVNGDGYDDVLLRDDAYAAVHLGSAAGVVAAPAWQLPWSGATNSGAGSGDVNGDGYGDVIIGMPFDGFWGQGAVEVYYGSAAGLPPSASWRVEGIQDHAQFGASVACAGDVDGDGYDDVIVGVPDYEATFQHEGAAAVFHGSAGGLLAAPGWTAVGQRYQASFGTAVAGAGDLNGDGYDDVVVGAPEHDLGVTGGRVHVFLGGPGGLAAVAAARVDGDQPNAYFGRTVAPAGDVNGDGRDDLLVGAYRYSDGEPDEGAAFLFLGR